jgi:hypothetical protein
MDISEFKRLQSTADINRHPWERARARIARYLLTRYKVPLDAIADVGSGDAFVLKYLAGNNPGGVHAAIDHAYTPDIVNALNAEDADKNIQFFDNIQKALAVNRFSCILLMDVIEHIKNDTTFLKDLVNTGDIQTGTSFLITVPAFQSLFSKHDVLLSHYRRYNVKQLTALCNKNNLRIVTSGYFFFSLLPVRLLHLLAERISMRKPEKAIDNWEGSHFVSNIISSILWIDFRICFSLSRINIRLPGLSCFCICQKSAL